MSTPLRAQKAEVRSICSSKPNNMDSLATCYNWLDKTKRAWRRAVAGYVHWAQPPRKPLRIRDKAISWQGLAALTSAPAQSSKLVACENAHPQSLELELLQTRKFRVK